VILLLKEAKMSPIKGIFVVVRISRPGRTKLWPKKAIDAGKTRALPTDHFVRHDEELLDIWARTKSKIWHFEIQDNQIANWFERNYHLEVGILDFDPPVPSVKFTADMLSHFCQSVDRYCSQ